MELNRNLHFKITQEKKLGRCKLLETVKCVEWPPKWNMYKSQVNAHENLRLYFGRRVVFSADFTTPSKIFYDRHKVRILS